MLLLLLLLSIVIIFVVVVDLVLVVVVFIVVGVVLGVVVVVLVGKEIYRERNNTLFKRVQEGHLVLCNRAVGTGTLMQTRNETIVLLQ